MAMLDSIVMMDESTVSFHMPESKMQSKQWTKKGQPGPIKAEVHATRSKQMVLAFFDNEVLIYTNYVPKGQTVNANYIVEALSSFLATFKKKRPNMVAGEWFFHWDNAPVHTATVVNDWMAAKDFRLIDHPPYLPDLAPADFLISDHQEAAGGQNTNPGDLQGDVGGGHQDHRQRGLRRCLQALVRSLREVRSDWRQIRREILRNKCLKISYRFFFYLSRNHVFTLRT
jgi:hypothetical protein